MKTTKKQPALRAEVFVQAAALLAAGSTHYACNALGIAIMGPFPSPLSGSNTEYNHRKNNLPEVVFFSDWLRPDTSPWNAWYSSQYIGSVDLDTFAEYQNARIFGLLLCAELVKDEQQKRRTKK